MYNNVTLIMGLSFEVTLWESSTRIPDNSSSESEGET